MGSLCTGKEVNETPIDSGKLEVKKDINAVVDKTTPVNEEEEEEQPNVDRNLESVEGDSKDESGQDPPETEIDRETMNTSEPEETETDVEVIENIIEVEENETEEEKRTRVLNEMLQEGHRVKYQGKWSMSKDIEEKGNTIIFDTTFSREKLLEEDGDNVLKISGKGEDHSFKKNTFGISGSLTDFTSLEITADFGKMKFIFEGNVTLDDRSDDGGLGFPPQGFQGRFFNENRKRDGGFYLKLL